MNPESRRQLVVPEGMGPERLDRLLARLMVGEQSRSSIARLIREGRVRLGGRPVKPSTEASGGDTVTVELPAPEPSDIPAEDLPLNILWQDEHLLVVDKAAGMVTHPAGPLRTGTLVNALLHHVGDLSGIGGVLRPGIVHRLDVGTTGLLVVAKHDESHRRLADALKRREIRRIYEAVAWGRVEPTEFMIDAPIGRHPRDRKRMAVVEGGREARSRVHVECATDLASHITVSLETGRTHQIRVHLRHRGHPLVGDATYGGRRRGVRRSVAGRRGVAPELLDLVDRPALHAKRLEFRHPFEGEELIFESPRPDDLQCLVRALDPEDCL